MRVTEIKIMRGPNYYSPKHNKLVVATLSDAGQPATPDLINSAEAKLSEGVRQSIFAEGQATDFFFGKNIQTLAELTASVAVKLQQITGRKVSWHEVRVVSDNQHLLLMEYEAERSGKYSLESAVSLIRSITEKKSYDSAKELQKIQDLYYAQYIGPSTSSIVDEAIARGIPAIGGRRSPFIQLGYGSKQKRISAALTSDTSNMGVDIAGNKDLAKEILDSYNIPVPKGDLVYNKYELRTAITELGFPVVIKPLDSNQGKGASINVNDWPCAVKSFLGARKYSKAVIVEKFIVGHDYRLLVVNQKVVAASLRSPASVTGDGNLTIQELIDKVNLDPRRGEGHEKVLTQIKIDEMTMRILNDKGLTPEYILPNGQELYLKDTANLSTGGTATDVTDLVHPENIFIAEQIAGITGLDICGIDMMTTDISKPLKETGGAIIEVNAAPGLRMHTHPTVGKPRNPGKAIVDMLFPPQHTYTIPIVAITGTNGKTSTTRLIAHMAGVAGHRVGYTNTDGIYVQNCRLETGDCSGPSSAEFVLKNPTVDFAVLECARGGVLRSGLGFEFCHTAVVTNIAPDHLGLKGINTVQEMADVKAVIPRTVIPEGFAVLNAADDLVYAMREKVKCRVALFALDAKNPRLQQHAAQGGVICTTENDEVILVENGRRHVLEKIKNIPITMGGRADFMTENAMGAILAGYSSGFPIEVIRKALLTFLPTPEQTPGRLNIFKINDIEVMVDYAHNPAGMTALGRFLRNVESPLKVGVFTAVGDRREEDIVEMGRLAAELFDKIIIRLDEDLRGATPEYIVEKLKLGISKANRQVEVEVIPNETEASLSAIKNAPAGAFIALCTDKVDRTIKIVRQYQKEVDEALKAPNFSDNKVQAHAAFAQ